MLGGNKMGTPSKPNASVGHTGQNHLLGELHGGKPVEYSSNYPLGHACVAFEGV